ncbi:nucleotidyltransferase family protein [Priestia aryabhattai]|uniref:nucleotidyltransferase domain-containing protein n=1 Tax=Priestia aryabhattai TaxID=412384 RepID=UPI003531B237
MCNRFQLDSTLMPKELKILLELIKSDNDKNLQQYKNEWFTHLDWDYLLKLAMHHRVYPLVYLKLKEVIPDMTPVYVLQALEVEYKKNTFKMLHLTGEMGRISDLFTGNHVRSLFLKGPVVAYDLYGDISLRTSKDLDILIPETDLVKAETVLLKEGYKKEKVDTVLNERKWRYHHIAYFHPKKKIQIEIHWRLHPRPMKEPTFDELWKRRRTSLLTNQSISFLGEEDLFLYLIAHGARHGWFRLRWLKDIDQIIKSKLYYGKYNSAIKKYKHKHLVGQAFILLNQLFNKSIKGNILNHKRSIKLSQNAYIYIVNDKDFRYSHRYLFSLKSNLQKMYFIILLFYPRFVDVETLALPKPFYFLYAPIRPLLWVWRKIIKLRA